MEMLASAKDRLFEKLETSLRQNTVATRKSVHFKHENKLLVITCNHYTDTELRWEVNADATS